MNDKILEQDIKEAEGHLESSDQSFALMEKFEQVTEILELETARANLDVTGELIALLKLNRLDEFKGILKGNRYTVNDEGLLVIPVCEKYDFLVAYHEIMQESRFAKFNLLHECFTTLNKKGLDYLLANNPACHRLQVDHDYIYCASIYSHIFNIMAVKKEWQLELIDYTKQTIIHDDLFVSYFYGHYYSERLISSKEAIDLQERTALFILKNEMEVAKQKRIDILERIERSGLDFETYSPSYDDHDHENYEFFSINNDITKITNFSTSPSIKIQFPNFDDKERKCFNDCEIHAEQKPIFEWLYDLGFDVYGIYANMNSFKQAMLVQEMNLFQFFTSIPKSDIDFEVLAWRMNLQQIFEVAVKLRAMPPTHLYSEVSHSIGTMIDNGTLRDKMIWNLKMQLRLLRKPKETAVNPKVKKI
ncbi:hypothetical protein [Serratia marcescens]|uniref:hypothetical protein n=1 Tax=Serratia marcescens TaxID=615 RepID=UPI001F14EB49|nr:hypothetical protein [Serratia marcescens]